jgi:Ankyrin repeats (3 copies)
VTTAVLLFAMALGSVQAAAPAASTPAKSPTAANPDDLLEAVRKGDLTAVKAALDAGVPVDHPFRYERTALSFAAARGQVEIVTLLLERGADPNKKDSFYGASPFNWAANESHVQVVRLLIEKGAPVGPELLMRAANNGSTELMALALEKSKPSADDLAMALAQAEESKHDKVVEQLKQAGARPAAPADFAVEPAVLASYAGAYKDERGGETRLDVREGKLVCVTCSPQGLVLGALDAVTFRHPTRPLPKVVFTVEGGKAQSFVLMVAAGRESTWRRVPDETPKEKP